MRAQDGVVTGKLDVKRSLDSYRAKAGEFRLLELEPRRYLMIDGHGDPNAPVFSEALESLYPVAYTLKFASKARGRDYVVPPLEGLWWAEDMDLFTTARDKSQWSWTAMILVPDWLGDEDVDAALEAVAAKKRPARLADVRLEVLDEGRCVQTLHIGSFDDEGLVLAQMHDVVIPGRGLRPEGRHHEIYLTDIRKSAPEQQRTILRQHVVDA